MNFDMKMSFRDWLVFWQFREAPERNYFDIYHQTGQLYIEHMSFRQVSVLEVLFFFLEAHIGIMAEPRTSIFALPRYTRTPKHTAMNLLLSAFVSSHFAQRIPQLRYQFFELALVLGNNSMVMSEPESKRPFYDPMAD